MNEPAPTRHPLRSASFSQYIGDLGKSRLMLRPIPLRTLLKIPNLVARAEDSGSEGCYIEVIKWNPYATRYERFAYEKVFAEEYWPKLSAVETAERIAALINLSHRGQSRYRDAHSIQRIRQGSYQPVFHSLPTWNPTKTLTR